MRPPYHVTGRPCYTASMPRALSLALLILTASGCAAFASALAVAQPVVGAVCLADGFAPIARTSAAWDDPRVIDALIAYAAAKRAPSVAASATLAARDAALPK